MKEIINRNYFNINFIKAIILSFIGGFIELYSLKVRGAFSGMQTGNLIYIFINLIDGNYTLSLFYLLILVIFIVGIIISELIFYLSNKFNFKYQYIVYPLEIISLLSIIFIPTNLDILDPLNILGMCILSLFSAVQSHIFTNINGHSLSTTMMTAMIKLCSSRLFLFFKDKNKNNLLEFLEILFIILFFIIGVVIFYLGYTFINIEYLNYLLFLLIFLILILFILFSFKYKFKKNN